MAMKLVSSPGCERIIRYAFEYAKINGRKKVTCITKSNILKITDGLFQEIFYKIAAEYPEITIEHMLVDIASARLASKPENFDVIVTLNLYGDILSDIASEVSGSVGLAGSANIGNNCAMFEAVHGSAADIAGKNIANPSGLLNSAILMLKYLGKHTEANKIYNAWLKTIEDGYHTPDIYSEEQSKEKLSTSEFTDAVISNFGKEPKQLVNEHSSGENKKISITTNIVSNEVIDLVGVDVYLKGEFTSAFADQLGALDDAFKLHMVSNRGLLIWPKNIAVSSMDFYRYRFLRINDATIITQNDIIRLINKINELKLEIISIIKLSNYDDNLGFSLAQGE
jgi:isocitrate dehydrogenase